MKNKIRSLFFAGLIIAIAIFNILTPEKTFSNKENRYLQTLPKFDKSDIVSGKFGESFEKYSSDQFLARNLWISLKTLSDLAIFKKDNGRVYFGQEDYLFDLDDKIDLVQSDKNIDSINKLLDSLRENQGDLDIYALLVASKGQILEDKLPSHAPKVDEAEIIEKLENSLRDNMQLLPLINLLKEKSDQYIYYRTDHHWTSKGAFYAYKYFLETKGENPLMADDFIIENVAKDFLGTSYRKANYYTGKADEIDIYKPKDPVNYDITVNQKDKMDKLYDSSFLDKADKYSYFLGGDEGIIEIDTWVKNGKTILIIKDSFANSLIPFLTNHYEKLIVLDPRYFNMGIMDYIEGLDIDEILFVFNIQNFIQEKTLPNILK